MKPRASTISCVVSCAPKAWGKTSCACPRILTPHAAGLTQEASHRMSEGAALQILQLLKGERPTFMVNPEIWPAHLDRVRGGT